MKNKNFLIDLFVESKKMFLFLGGSVLVVILIVFGVNQVGNLMLTQTRDERDKCVFEEGLVWCDVKKDCIRYGQEWCVDEDLVKNFLNLNLPRLLTNLDVESEELKVSKIEFLNDVEAMVEYQGEGVSGEGKFQFEFKGGEVVPISFQQSL